MVAYLMAWILKLRKDTPGPCRGVLKQAVRWPPSSLDESVEARLGALPKGWMSSVGRMVEVRKECLG